MEQIAIFLNPETNTKVYVAVHYLNQNMVEGLEFLSIIVI